MMTEIKASIDPDPVLRDRESLLGILRPFARGRELVRSCRRIVCHVYAGQSPSWRCFDIQIWIQSAFNIGNLCAGSIELVAARHDHLADS